MSVANKISHAHLHAYELHLSAADIDPHATVRACLMRSLVMLRHADGYKYAD